MIFHKKCKYTIKADLSESIRVLATFSIIGKFTAQATECSIKKRTHSGKAPLVLFCEKCNRIVKDFDEVICPCDSCGEVIELSKIKIPVESGGMYCSECIKKFKDEKIYSVSVKDIKLPG